MDLPLLLLKVAVILQHQVRQGQMQVQVPLMAAGQDGSLGAAPPLPWRGRDPAAVLVVAVGDRPSQLCPHLVTFPLGRLALQWPFELPPEE